MTSAFGGYLASYGNYAPYLTNREFRNAPTALDLNNLLSGNSEAQDQALTEVIHRASSWIDGHVTNTAWGTLNATSNVENARVWGNRLGQLICHTRLWPCLEVQAFSYAPVQSGFNAMASVSPSSNIWVEPQQFVVQPSGITAWNFQTSVGITTNEYFVQYQYVNGFANTVLSASVASGATSIEVDSGLGIYPNMMFTLFDPPNDEGVIIASDYVPDSSTVLLQSPLRYEHTSGSTFTSLPKAVKQACILLTGALIKQRGSGSMIISDIGPVERVDGGLQQGESGDIALAAELLVGLRQQFIGW